MHVSPSPYPPPPLTSTHPHPTIPVCAMNLTSASMFASNSVPTCDQSIFFDLPRSIQNLSKCSCRHELNVGDTAGPTVCPFSLSYVNQHQFNLTFSIALSIQSITSDLPYLHHSVSSKIDAILELISGLVESGLRSRHFDEHLFRIRSCNRCSLNLHHLWDL